MNRQRLAIIVCAVALLMLAFGQSASAKKKKKPTQPPPAPAVPAEVANLPLEELSRRVAALETIDAYQLTRDQGESLLKMIEPIKPAPATPTTAPASKDLDAYHAELIKLYLALVKGGVEDDDLDELKADVDDLVETAQYIEPAAPEPSALARELGRKFAAQLTAGQIASSLSLYASNVADPVELALAAAISKKGAKAQDQWPAVRDSTASELGYLLAGADDAAAKAIAGRVSAWLDANPDIDEPPSGLARATWEENARKILGPVDSWTVLRRWVERDVARMLSNPQLSPMLHARLNPPDSKK